MPLPLNVQAGKFIRIVVNGVNYTGIINVTIISLFEGKEVVTTEKLIFDSTVAIVSFFNFVAPQGDYLFFSIIPNSPNVKAGQLWANIILKNDESSGTGPFVFFGSGYIGKQHPLTLSSGTGKEDLITTPYNWLQTIGDVTNGNVAFTNFPVFVFKWVGMHFLYTAAVGGSARQIRVKITDDNGNVAWDHTDPATILANSATHVSFSLNHADQGGGTSDIVLQIPDFQLPDEATVTLSFTNQQAGDIASEITFSQAVQVAQN